MLLTYSFWASFADHLSVCQEEEGNRQVVLKSSITDHGLLPFTCRIGHLPVGLALGAWHPVSAVLNVVLIQNAAFSQSVFVQHAVYVPGVVFSECAVCCL